MYKRKGKAPLIIGIIMGVIGAILCFSGNQTNGDYSRQFESFFSTGRRDATGDALITGGTVLIVVGIILVIIGICLYVSSGSSSNQTAAYGAITLSGTYISNDGTYSVVFYNNGRCVWCQNGKQYNAIFRAITPNSWTIDIDGFGNAFTATLTGYGLSVQGGSINTVFIKQG